MKTYNLPDGFTLEEADPDIFEDNRQDSAWYKHYDNDEVFLLRYEKDGVLIRIQLLCVGEMRINYNGYSIRYLQDLLEAGITNDMELFAIPEECWRNNSWFEVWNVENEEYSEAVYHNVEDALNDLVSDIQNQLTLNA